MQQKAITLVREHDLAIQRNLALQQQNRHLAEEARKAQEQLQLHQDLDSKFRTQLIDELGIPSAKNDQILQAIRRQKKRTESNPDYSESAMGGYSSDY